MTTPIRTNKPVFFGNNGEVLKSGYIYIGQPRQDPRNFPKTVTFQDSAGGLFTAAQPLRTNAQGQISYNGKAIIALVDGDYSLLVQDSNQVQTKDGWTPLIEADESDPNASTVVYRSLLSELKAVNVTPGQYVENIGKITVQDGEGARWLVVSNTGSPGDDVDLIDFDNGTQGVRIENQLYTLKNLSEIAAAGASDQTEARANLGQSTSVNIADDAVTEPKIAVGAVIAEKIPDGELGSEKFQTGAEERDWVLARNAAASAEAIGSYALLRYVAGTILTPGGTASGANLRWANADGGSLGTPPAGVWRCMGYVPNAPATTADETTLFLRIS